MNIAASISDEDQDMFDYATVSHGLYIGGRWQPSSEGRVIEVVDPSTEAVIAAVPDATLADAAAAVDAAAKAAAGCTVILKPASETPLTAYALAALYEEAGVPRLPAPAAAHEAPELFVGGPAEPRRLLLQRAEGPEVPVGFDDRLHGGGAEGADQLVLEVGDAHEEPEPFQVRAAQVRSQTGPLERPCEVALLAGVAEARQPDVQPAGAEPVDEASDRLRASHRHDRDGLGLEVPAVARGQRFESQPVAEAFDEDDGSRRRLRQG